MENEKEGAPTKCRHAEKTGQDGEFGQTGQARHRTGEKDKPVGASGNPATPTSRVTEKTGQAGEIGQARQVK